MIPDTSSSARIPSHFLRSGLDHRVLARFIRTSNPAERLLPRACRRSRYRRASASYRPARGDALRADIDRFTCNYGALAARPVK